MKKHHRLHYTTQTILRVGMELKRKKKDAPVFRTISEVGQE